MKVSQRIQINTNGTFNSTLTGTLTASRSHALPDRDGTIAMLDQIPSTPTAEPVVQVTGATKTFGLTDAQTFQLISNGATAVTLTIPSDTTVAFPVGTEITIAQDGTGTVTINTATTPTPLANLRRMGSTATTGHIMLGQYAITVIKKVAANEWRAYGGLSW